MSVLRKTENKKGRQYLYLTPVIGEACLVTDNRLANFTERHKIKLDLPPLTVIKYPLKELKRHQEVDGLIISLKQGWLNRTDLKLAKRALKMKREVWLYWPDEEAIEYVDRERLQSYWHHWLVVCGYRLFKRLSAVAAPLKPILRQYIRRPQRAPVASPGFDEIAKTERGGTNQLPLSSNLEPGKATQFDKLDTDDAYKDEVQNQWNNNPVGSQFVKNTQVHTLEWFLEVETYRYGQYAPWMPETMEFTKHSAKRLLEIGGGLGADLCQFALHGAQVTDLDLSLGHLELARENFKLRGLPGRFIHHDAEDLPFDDNSFDVVYSSGVLHHTPNTIRVVREIYRVLKPGGRVIVMVYAENSLHYWFNLVWNISLGEGLLNNYSMGEIMSRRAEITETNARPLVKVYSGQRLKHMFKEFANVNILKRQLRVADLPTGWDWFPVTPADRLIGWNLILKAIKP